MTSNLLIGYSDIPRTSTITLSDTQDSNYPSTNLVMGGRGLLFRYNAAVTSAWIKCDAGASGASMSYFALCRANLLKTEGVTKAVMASSPNDAAWTDRIGTSAAFQTRTFTGPRSTDLLFTSTFNDQVGAYTASAIRYWRLTMDGTSGKRHFSKLFLGSWFDMGREPIYPAEHSRAAIVMNGREAPCTFSLSWQGITNTSLNSFIDKIVKYKDIAPVFLYDTNGYVLNGWTTFHAWVKNVSIQSNIYNQNSLTVVFEEAI